MQAHTVHRSQSLRLCNGLNEKENVSVKNVDKTHFSI